MKDRPIVGAFGGIVAEAFEAATPDAKALAQSLVEHRFSLLIGDYRTGILGLFREELLRRGGELVPLDVPAATRTTEQHFAERFGHVLTRADALVVLPGGLGTLVEATQLLHAINRGAHVKPVAFLSSHSFFEPLKSLVESIVASGGASNRLLDQVLFDADPSRLAARLFDALNEV